MIRRWKNYTSRSTTFLDERHKVLFDYALIASLLLVTLSIPIALLIRSSVLKHSKNKEVPYIESQKKMSFQLRLLSFFLISILIGRFLFCLAFPEQLSRLIIKNTPYLVDVAYLVLQISITAYYLFWVFLLSISRHFKIQGRFHLIRAQIKKIAFFLFADAIVSGALYIVISNQLLIPAPTVLKNSATLVSSFTSILLLTAFVLCFLFFWLTQRKRSKSLYYVFYLTVVGSSLLSLYALFIQYGLYTDGSRLIFAFTYRQAFYGWILMGFALLAISSQILAGILIRLRSKFINRYFSVNYILQLNRITLISTTALLLSALLPTLIINILIGAKWLL